MNLNVIREAPKMTYIYSGELVMSTRQENVEKVEKIFMEKAGIKTKVLAEMTNLLTGTSDIF